MTASVYYKDWVLFSAFMFLMMITVMYMWCIPPITESEEEEQLLTHDLEYGSVNYLEPAPTPTAEGV